MSETLNAQDIAKKLQEQLTSLSATVDTHEVSTVDEVGDGIARVSGLKSAMAGELLEFKSSDTGETVFGLAQNLGRRRHQGRRRVPHHRSHYGYPREPRHARPRR